LDAEQRYFFCIFVNDNNTVNVILKSLKDNTLVGIVFAVLVFAGFACSAVLPYGGWMWIVPQSGSLIFDDIRNFLGSWGTPVILGVSFVLLNLVEVGVMTSLNRKYELSRAKGAFFFVITAAVGMCYIPYNVLLPEQFAAVFVMLGLFPILESNGKDVAVYNLFDAGLCFGIATLFCFNAVITLFYGIAAIAVFRPYRTNEILMMILGLVTPVLFYFAGYYLVNGEIMPVWENIVEEFSIRHVFNPAGNDIVFLCAGGVLLLVSSVFMVALYSRFNVFEARAYRLMFVIFLITLVAAVSPFLSIETLRLALFPVVYMLVTVFYNMRQGFWSEVFFALLLLSAGALHVYLVVDM